MVLDRTDVRSTMASYGATTRPTATDFVPCEYVRFYDTEPQETTAGARTWYARGQNFVLAYTQVESGAEFARTNQRDEYMVFVPDRDGPSLEITAGAETANVAPYSIAFIPPGDSRIKVTGKRAGGAAVQRARRRPGRQVLECRVLCAAASERRAPRAVA